MALAITLLIEGAVVFLFGFRSIRDQLRIALVNGITHPLFHGALLFIGTAQWQSMPDITVMIIVFEALICVSEWFLLSWLYPKKSKRSLLVVSLCMNAASASFGVLFPFIV